MVTMGVGPVRSVLLLFAQIQQNKPATTTTTTNTIPRTTQCRLIPQAQIQSVAEPLICQIKIFPTL